MSRKREIGVFTSLRNFVKMQFRHPISLKPPAKFQNDEMVLTPKPVGSIFYGGIEVICLIGYLNGPRILSGDETYADTQTGYWYPTTARTVPSIGPTLAK